MRFILDEHISRQFELLLTARGHIVDRAEGGISDMDIMAWADRDGAVIVAADKHFRPVLSRKPTKTGKRYPGASLVRVQGEAGPALERLIKTIDILEAVYLTCQRENDKRLVMHIRPSTVFIEI